jgi:hypothetical protein
MMDVVIRSNWRIHPNVIEFWEKQGKNLYCVGDYWENNGLMFGAATYFYEEGYDQYAIARHDYNHIPNMIYILDNKHYLEEEFLKIIRLPAFI